MNFYTFPYVDTLARPMSNTCFQMFVVEPNPMSFNIVLCYIDGTARNSLRCEASESVLRLIARDPSIREEYLAQFPHIVDPMDHNNVYFKHRMVRVLYNLASEQGCVFMYLRGSEVSLDRLVQMEESSPSSPSEKSVTR